MSKPVKKKRAYSSPVREEQAAITRRRILDAAGALFTSAGYGQTTVKAIASHAGVAADTVYAVFGTKARVLTALIDERLGGGSNVMDRPEARAVFDEPDARRRIGAFAGDMAALSSRVRPVYEILRTASAVDPDMAAVHAEMDGYRLRNMRAFVDALARTTPLKVTRPRAADVVWTLASPDVARMLCDVRGWTESAYASWLADSLCAALLDPDV